MKDPLIITPELTQKMLESMKNSPFLEEKKQRAIKAYERDKPTLQKLISFLK